MKGHDPGGVGALVVVEADPGDGSGPQRAVRLGGQWWQPQPGAIAAAGRREVVRLAGGR